MTTNRGTGHVVLVLALALSGVAASASADDRQRPFAGPVDPHAVLPSDSHDASLTTVLLVDDSNGLDEATLRRATNALARFASEDYPRDKSVVVRLSALRADGLIETARSRPVLFLLWGDDDTATMLDSEDLAALIDERCLGDLRGWVP